MNAKLRQVQPLGYEGTSMFPDSPSQSLYRKRIPECCAVLVLSNYTPRSIQVFRLTQEEYRAYSKGKLSLVPLGCCCASGGPCVENADKLWEGEFKSGKQIVDLLTTFERTLREEGRPSCK